MRSVRRKEITILPVIVQNDNTAAVDAVNRGRARNHALAIILRAVANAAASSVDQFMAAHLQGERNGIADKLSRNKIDEAKAESRRLFNRADVVLLPKEAKPIVDATIRAACQALRAKARTETLEKRKEEAMRKKQRTQEQQQVTEPTAELKHADE